MTNADQPHATPPISGGSVARAPHVKQIGLALVIASLVAIGFATLLPEPPARAGSHLCLVCGSLGVVNAVLNVGLFVPLGVGLALYGLGWKRAIISAGALSTAIELTQWLVITGRYSTVGDVVTNTLGAAIGFALVRNAIRLFKPEVSMARALVSGWSVVWLGIQLLSNYGLVPVLPASQYYGQLARSLGSFDLFRGQVLAAKVDSQSIPNSIIGNSSQIRILLERGSAVQAVVIPSSPTRSVAPIVRIADNRRREIGILGQNGVDFIFGVRTGASVLKLHSPLFALPAVFPATGDDADMSLIRLSGAYHGEIATLRAGNSETGRDAQIPVRASLAWTFWLPFQWYVEGTRWEFAIGVVWMLVLIVPLGYWSSAQAAMSGRPLYLQRVQFSLVGAGVVIAGLVVVPALFGVPLASISDWLATLAGFALGVRVANVGPGAPLSAGTAAH